MSEGECEGEGESVSVNVSVRTNVRERSGGERVEVGVEGDGVGCPSARLLIVVSEREAIDNRQNIRRRERNIYESTNETKLREKYEQCGDEKESTREVDTVRECRNERRKSERECGECGLFERPLSSPRPQRGRQLTTVTLFKEKLREEKVQKRQRRDKVPEKTNREAILCVVV